MIEEVALPDGTGAVVVPLLPRDREQLSAAFDELSPETRRSRFLAPVRHLSPTMLEHLVDDVDGVDHVALVLCVETAPDTFDPVALARIVRYADVTDAADLAVTVTDAWQGRGVATTLLDVLVRHRPAGVTRIETEVLKDNPASLAMLRRLGPVTLHDDGDGAYGVVVDLDPDGTRPPAPPASPSRTAPLLRDPHHRHALRVRDQVCPWLR
ncbi:GNAT family N-acetyltransferase [Nocardioides sp. J2M5]|uniref:GNAT family N-acetyltransferase n=1 Tax=Nocardioides palaemonis TaxID=2829810 RepID=UPI001BA888E1|nr:GNAT family N-acetyltransferase [Nocardioides palaemonis]MBS2938791.1 GNAT family N-acetyltransferase [Nocardioides palaemonis]